MNVIESKRFCGGIVVGGCKHDTVKQERSLAEGSSDLHEHANTNVYRTYGH